MLPMSPLTGSSLAVRTSLGVCGYRITDAALVPFVNAFQWMTVWLGVLVVAVLLIWFLTRTRQH
jgi:hypothetical protein